MRRNRIEEPASFTDEANAQGLSQLLDPVEPKSKHTYDADAKDGTYVPMRRWYCRNRVNCKGRAAWTGWEQLTDAPTCPDCGGAMHWVQWLGRR